MRVSYLILLLLFCKATFAQQKEVHVKWIEEEISLDGNLDEGL